MRSRSFICLVVAALGVGAMATEQPAQAPYGDILVLAAIEPAELMALAGPQAGPNVWVPAEYMVATWESITAMSRLDNSATAGAVAKRSLSLSARVDVVDVNSVLGFDYAPQGTLVLDGKPSVIYSKAAPKKYCHFYWSLRYLKEMSGGQWVSKLQPYHLTVDMPLDPNRPYPALLSRVEWSMYALINTESKTVDVPFSVGADWVTLMPGVEIKVEQATAGTSSYQYRFTYRYSRSKVMWSSIAGSGGAIPIWSDAATPEVIVAKMDILDAQGKSLTSSGSFVGGSGSGGGSSGGGAGGSAGGDSGGDSGDGASGGASARARRSASDGADDLITIAAEPSSDTMTGASSGMGSYSGGGTATTFRFTLALKPQQQQLRFILENVPVPLL